MAQELLFLRDLADVEPDRQKYKLYDKEDIYKHVPKPQWTGLEDEIWTPRANEHDPQLEKVRELLRRNQESDGMTGAADCGGGRICPTCRDLCRVGAASSSCLPHRELHARTNYLLAPPDSTTVPYFVRRHWC